MLMHIHLFAARCSSLIAAGILAGSTLFSAAVMAEPSKTPDAFIKSIAEDVLAEIKADKEIQAGDMSRVNKLVETKILPHVNFVRMTSLAVGRYWARATPDQQKALQTEFRGLLTRTYAGALSAAKDAQIQMRPLRASPEDSEVVVRSQVVQGRGDPIQLDYRMEKSATGWKIYDFNVLGVWLVETYKASFAQEIDKNGLDGLIKTMKERNKRLEEASVKKQSS